MPENRVKCLNPWDPQSKRQYSADGIYPCLDAGHGGGGQQHGVCYSVDCRNLRMNQGLSGTLQTKEEGGWSLNYLNPVLYKAKDE